MSFKCSLCRSTFENDFVKVVLNGKEMCSCCVVGYVYNRGNGLLDVNTLVDVDYTYKLSKDLLVGLVMTSLTPEQYKELVELYPNSFYLHSDFYDKNGVALQPKL